MVYAITQINNETTENKNSGSNWKPIVFSFLVSIPFFTEALQTTDLSANFRFSVLPPTKVPWTVTSKILAAIISTPVFCITINKYGRKTGLYLVMLCQAILCIPLFLTPNDITSILAYIVTGITYSGLFITIPIYIREINDDKNRAMMMALTMILFSLGKVIAAITEFETVIFIIIALVVIQFLMLTIVVETPSYHVMTGKTERAFDIVEKLKCVPKNDAIVSREINILNDESNRAKDKGKLNLYRILKNVIWRDCTVIGLVLYSVMTLCGSSIFLDQRKTLVQLKLEQDPHDVLVYVLLMAGSAFTFVVLFFMERKYLISFGCSIMAFFLGILAVFTQADLTIATLRWIPLVCLAIVIFGYGVTWMLPLILMTEMYNLQIRSSLLGLLFIYSEILNLIHLHTLKYIEDLMGVYTILYVFSAVNLYGAVYCLFKIPDVRNKSVRQIERRLKRIPLIKL